MLGECFGVSMDELLGVNEAEKQREIDRIVCESEELDSLREKIRSAVQAHFPAK